MQSMRQVLQFMNFALAEGMFSTLHPGESISHACIDRHARAPCAPCNDVSGWRHGWGIANIKLNAIYFSGGKPQFQYSFHLKKLKMNSEIHRLKHLNLGSGSDPLLDRKLMILFATDPRRD